MWWHQFTLFLQFQRKISKNSRRQRWIHAVRFSFNPANCSIFEIILEDWCWLYLVILSLSPLFKRLNMLLKLVTKNGPIYCWQTPPAWINVQVLISMYLSNHKRWQTNESRRIISTNFENVRQRVRNLSPSRQTRRCLTKLINNITQNPNDETHARIVTAKIAQVVPGWCTQNWAILCFTPREG